MATQAQGTEEAAGAAALSPGKGLVVLALVVVGVVAFIAISTAVGLATFFGGFLFVFYYTGVCHAAPDKFVPAALGAFAVSPDGAIPALQQTATLAGMALSVALAVALIGAVRGISALAAARGSGR